MGNGVSWPTDGEPRYVLHSLSGQGIGQNGMGAKVGTELCIHDRARCHRVVVRIQSSQFVYLGKATERVRLLCARLNAADQERQAA